MDRLIVTGPIQPGAYVKPNKYAGEPMRALRADPDVVECEYASGAIEVWPVVMLQVLPLEALQ